MPTFALNFSRPGNQIVAQYYNFIRLGFEGYERIQRDARNVAMYLSNQIANLGPFQLITDGSELPVFAFELKDTSGYWSVFDLSKVLRQGGWLLPAYTFPANREDVAALRIVVKKGFTRDLADLLVADFRRSLNFLDRLDSRLPLVEGETGDTFHH
jgi:glutamate decarboxylase